MKWTISKRKGDDSCEPKIYAWKGAGYPTEAQAVLLIELDGRRTSVEADAAAVRGAREHNLKSIDVKIPKKKLVVMTGVSGSGKSTLIIDTLGRALAPKKHTTSVASEPVDPGPHERLDTPEVLLGGGGLWIERGHGRLLSERSLAWDRIGDFEPPTGDAP